MRQCLHCKNMTSNPKFCSRSCAAAVNGSSYPKRKPEHKCKSCEAPVTAKKRYCASCALERATRITAPRQNYKIVKTRRAKLKEFAVQYKGGKCIICSYDKCHRSMGFHHLDPTKKDFGISTKSFHRSKAALILELDKCVLLCANCHGEVHDGITKIPDQYLK
jgi:hypothetical protein